MIVLNEAIALFDGNIIVNRIKHFTRSSTVLVLVFVHIQKDMEKFDISNELVHMYRI